MQNVDELLKSLDRLETENVIVKGSNSYEEEPELEDTEIAYNFRLAAATIRAQQVEIEEAFEEGRAETEGWAIETSRRLIAYLEKRGTPKGEEWTADDLMTQLTESEEDKNKIIEGLQAEIERLKGEYTRGWFVNTYKGQPQSFWNTEDEAADRLGYNEKTIYVQELIRALLKQEDLK